MGFCPDGKTEVSMIVKYLLLFGTFLHWVLAVALVSIGVWAFTEKNKYFYQPITDVYDFFFDLSILMIIVGCIMFIITTCGFVGALRENTCLLKIFYIALAVVFIGECAIGILAFSMKSQVIDVVTGVLQEGYVKKYHNDEDGVIDHFQENYDCCGIKDYTDWNLNEYFNCSSSNPSSLSCAVPYSCCRDPDAMSPGLNNIFCGKDALDDGNSQPIWTRGCVDALIEFASNNLPIIGGIALAIAVPQLMGIVLGRMFDTQIQRQWDRVRHSQQRAGAPANNRQYPDHRQPMDRYQQDRYKQDRHQHRSRY